MSSAGEAIDQKLECSVQPSAKILDFGTTSLVQETLPVIQSMPGKIIQQRSYLKNEAMQSEPDKKRKKSQRKEILLSDSTMVGSMLRSMYKVEIVHPLETFYRPRYKSDYFAQNGLKRKPRYDADRFNNHYITLKVREKVLLNILAPTRIA